MKLKLCYQNVNKVKAMSKITNSIKQLWAKFCDKEYRDGFIDDTISDSLAVQIQSLRLKEGWTQDFLAQKAGTKQAGVCRWENSQPPASLATLKKIASAFDVALVVKFVPFSEFLVGDGYPVDRVVASFTNDRLPSPTIIKAVVSPTRGRARTYTQHGRNVPPISRTMAAGTESRISR